MPAIVVESALYERVEEVASDQEASVGEVLAEAIRAYLWQQDRRKIEYIPLSVGLVGSKGFSPYFTLKKVTFTSK